MHNRWATALLAVTAIAGAAQAPGKGTIDTVAGTGARGYAGDGGPAVKAKLDQPFHCDVGAAGALYIAEAGNHCIRKVERATGLIATVAGTGKKGYTGDGGPATQV